MCNKTKPLFTAHTRICFSNYGCRARTGLHATRRAISIWLFKNPFNNISAHSFYVPYYCVSPIFSTPVDFYDQTQKLAATFSLLHAHTRTLFIFFWVFDAFFVSCAFRKAKQNKKIEPQHTTLISAQIILLRHLRQENCDKIEAFYLSLDV